MRASVIIFPILACCGCTSLLERPVEITPDDIYSWEDQHYPASHWEYLGSRGQYHYFDRSNIGMTPLKLHRRYLPDFEGYPYHRDHPILESADVEVWADHIRIEIDGEKPLWVPFKSKGFITADRRPARQPRQPLPAPPTTSRVIPWKRLMENHETLRVEGPSTTVIE